MSDTKQGTHLSQQTQGKTVPKAVVHKKILDAAGEHPNASIAELAESVDGASTQLVERVLDRYGDPAKTEAGDTASSGEETAGSDEGSEDDATAPQEQSMDQPTDPSDFVSVNSPPAPMSDSAAAEETEEGASVEADEPQAQSGRDDEDGTTAGTDATAADGGESTVSATQAGAANDAGTTLAKRPNPEDGDEQAADDDKQMDEPDLPDLSQLTEKQRSVLNAIYQKPHATQGELAEIFDVSRATICQRVNAIDGFK